MQSEPLRVCIDARLTTGTLGGVEQFVVGLAASLSGLGDGDEEYLVLAHPDHDEWLRPYVSGRCRLLHGTAATRQRVVHRVLHAFPGVGAGARKLLQPLLQTRGLASRLPLPRSDGLIEKTGVALIHFPNQSAFLTDVPSIYHPWDLQHIHLPTYFDSGTVRARETAYRAFCAQARMVSVATTWQKRDLIAQYRLPEDKVRVVAPGSVLSLYPTPSPSDLGSAQQRFALPPRFIYYPAQTWPHKNHLGLLDALARLRARDGLTVPLVSSGKRNDFYPEVDKRIRELKLEGQVIFLGFVSPRDVQCLYRLCQFMVFPTFFEGFGLPLLEAFEAEAPVACSSTSSVAALAGDAALLFDPHNPAEIADSIRRLWTDTELCGRLVERGRERLKPFSWKTTARLFRAHYRRLGGRRLSEEDQALLAFPAPV
jgi:glycosyltransferase involved in cell wall biosynthesis